MIGLNFCKRENDVKNIFKFLFLALLTVGVALFSLVFLIPSGFVEFAFSQFAAPFESVMLVALTVGVALFFKPKIESFIERVVARRPDRYVINAS